MKVGRFADLQDAAAMLARLIHKGRGAYMTCFCLRKETWDIEK